MLGGARRHRSRPGCAKFAAPACEMRPRQATRRGYAQPRCASSSSPTSCPTRRRRSAGAGSATRSTRSAPRGIEVEVFGFPPGRAEYLPATRRLRRAAARASASTSSTPTTGCRAGARGSPARGRCSSPSTAPTSATGVVGPLSRRLAWRVDLVAGRLAGALRRRRTAAPACPAVPGSAVLPCGPDLGRFGPLPREPRPARDARPRPRRPLPALPRQPGPAGEAPRPRRRAGRGLRRRAAHRRLDRAGRRCRSGSTPPTPSSSPPTTRASGWLRSRRSPATCRSSRPRSASPPTPSPASTAASAPPSTSPSGRPPRVPHLEAADPRVAGAARAASLSAARMAERTIEAYRDVTRPARNRLSLAMSTA